MDEARIWEEVGAEGFERIVAGFYRRVREDDLFGPMYPEDDWEGAEERLADFLKFRIGMDETYLKKRGHPRLRMRHLPFAIGEAERDRWLELMGAAVEEEGMSGEVAGELMVFFEQVAEFMRNR
ncbi:MAG: globin [Verrucomicrobiota bacterium]